MGCTCAAISIYIVWFKDQLNLTAAWFVITVVYHFTNHLGERVKVEICKGKCRCYSGIVFQFFNNKIEKLFFIDTCRIDQAVIETKLVIIIRNDEQGNFINILQV